MELLLYIIKQPQFILLFICALILIDFIKKISSLKKHNDYIDKSIMKYKIYNDKNNYNRRDEFTEDTYAYTQSNLTSENVAMEFMQRDVNRAFMEDSLNEATRLSEEGIRDVERIETPFELGGENWDIDDSFNDNFNGGFDDSFNDSFNNGFNDPFPPMGGF